MMNETFQLEWVQPLHAAGPEEKYPATRLIGHVRILGQDFHVNAEEVRDMTEEEIDDGTESGSAGMQTTVLPEEDDTYAPEIWEFCDGPGVTVNIDGREYLLAITPFQR